MTPSPSSRARPSPRASPTRPASPTVASGPPSRLAGYTGWDVTSPAYILENPNGNTLCIPTVFISMTGEALDNKTPLLRSQQAMAKQAARVLHLFGHENPDAVVSFAGAEQEYFLIDRSFFLSRPDLLNSGRTLFGAKPPKGQEFDDHYFGAIPERVLAFMMDCERELFKLGIPAKTRHNEVAPGQFELAPMFERSNVAADHQQLLMTTLKRVAQKHGMECLFHEKPFEGINGSGKHVNFSLGNSTQGNLLLPGDTPHDNAQFLVFCAAVIRSVHKYGGLLRASVASATNDHRLGANEAPPAIISIFLGDQLADVFEQIAQGGRHDLQGEGLASRSASTRFLCCRPTPATATAPVRSPSPATASSSGRPVRCSPSPGPMVTINTILAEALDHIATEIEAQIAGGAEFNAAVQTVLETIIKDHGAVVFNEDGYADEWQTEAAERGLPNLKTTLDALPELDHRGVDGALQPLRGLQPPGDAQPLRDRSRAVHPLHPRRGGADTRDGQHHHPAGCAALPDRAGHEPRQPHGDRAGVRLDHPGRGVGRRSRHCEPASPRFAPRWTTKRPTLRRSTPSTPRRVFFRPWPRCGRPPTLSRPWWPTTCGRCRPTRRCSSSFSPAQFGFVGSSSPGAVKGARGAHVPRKRAGF